MLSEEKSHALQTFLGGLPVGVACRLARMVELDFLNDGKLPHDAILSLLRPVLRKDNNFSRTPTPLRAFCRPFEDLLFSGPRKEKRKGCISRSAILPVWNWLKRELVGEAVTDFVGDFKSFVMAGEHQSADECARGFWKLASEAMMEAFACDPDRARDAVGGDALFADAEEMALLMSAGSLMMELQTLLPKPTHAVKGTHLAAFRLLYERVIVTAPDIAPYLPVAAMGRLEKPWQALRLALVVSHRRSDTLIAATDIGLVGDILFARMEDARAAIHAFYQSDFDPDALLDKLSDFTLISSAIAAEVDILRSGRWGKRLLANRSAVASVMEAYLDRAGREIAAVLPLRHNDVGTQTTIPDLSADLDEAQADRACRYARLIVGCRYIASAASFANKFKTVSDATVDLVCRYDDAILAAFGAATNEKRARIQERFELAAEMSKILLGREEGELFIRRGALVLAA